MDSEKSTVVRVDKQALTSLYDLGQKMLGPINRFMLIHDIDEFEDFLDRINFNETLNNVVKNLPTFVNLKTFINGEDAKIVNLVTGISSVIKGFNNKKKVKWLSVLGILNDVDFEIDFSKISECVEFFVDNIVVTPFVNLNPGALLNPKNHVDLTSNNN